MSQIARDTQEGLVLRSRFWLGAGQVLPPEQLVQDTPVDVGLRLMQHAHAEFTVLARLLPALYNAEHPSAERIEYPW